MTGFPAVNRIVEVLNLATVGDIISPAKLSISGGIYPWTKPERQDDDEFIVVNSLRTEDAVLQIVPVNVNVFVKDIEPGTPNNGRLEELAEIVLSLFPDSDITNGIYADNHFTDIIPDSDKDRHYVNIRLKVKMLKK